MLTTVVLRDSEIARLSRVELLAIEHLLHDRLSEVARCRRSGDSALLLAIKAADYLAPLLDELGDGEADEIVDRVAHSEVGREALERAEAIASLTDAAAA